MLIIRREISRASSQPGGRRCADLRKNGAQGPGREQAAERDATTPQDLGGHEAPRGRESLHTVKQATRQLPRRRWHLVSSGRQFRSAQEPHPGRKSTRAAG